MKTKLEVKNRIYRLTSRATPLSYMLQNRNTKHNALMYFDGETNRALRYARNQKSPFEDDQDENPILEPIIFVDGFLTVQKENRVLQEFLACHPGNGGIFEEVNNENDAAKEVDWLELEVDALSAAKKLDIEKAESIGRFIIGARIDKMTPSELRRDLMVFAKQNPTEFLELLSDPELDLYNTAQKAIDDGLLSVRNGGRDVFYNLGKNKKKMLTVPFDQQPVDAVSAYLKTNDGIEFLKVLEKKLAMA